MDTPTKVCAKCKLVKEHAAFGIDKRSKNGLKSCCRACVNNIGKNIRAKRMADGRCIQCSREAAVGVLCDRCKKKTNSRDALPKSELKIAPIRSLDDIRTRCCVDETTGCWVWGGAISPSGYGRAKFGDRTESVHRIVWRFVNGIDILDGLFICHHCDNPPCCNPDHLFLGTQSDNIRDCVTKKRHRPGRLAGETNHKSKLTENDVRSLRAIKHCYHGMQRDLAIRYNVSVLTIRRAMRGESWAHLRTEE